MISLVTPNISKAVVEPHPDEAYLLQQLSYGCEQSFNALFEKYWDKAYTDAFKRTKDTDVAKDIVQEVFIHIWVKRDAMRILNLPAYLNVAIRNRVFKHLEKKALHDPYFDIMENVPSVHFKTDENILWKDFFNCYELLVKDLPAGRQNIFRLRYQEDLSTKAIAEELGISRKTVQNQLCKVVKKLKISLLPLLPTVLLFL